MGMLFRAAMGAVFLGIFTHSAYAYLDPGTGSIILQVLLGGIAGLALVGRLYWHKLLLFLGARKDVETEVAEDRQSEPQP
jgi:hypothetical protein